MPWKKLIVCIRLKKILCKHSLFVNPESVVPGNRNDANLRNGNKVDAVPVGTYTNPKNGSKWFSHHLFSDNTKISLRIQVSYDGMGKTNALWGHSSIHNVGIFYFTIQNLPLHFNTCFPNVHLFAVCYTGDFKKYGFRPVLQRFMKNIKILETTGIIIIVAGRGEVIFLALYHNFPGTA